MTVDGVILAAGFSRRMGQFKPALPIKDKPLLERCIENMQPVCNRIIVVGGYNFLKTAELTQPLSGVTLVKNEHFEKGMFSSVQSGIRAVNAGRFFLLPGDQPAVKTKTFREMLAIEGDIVVPRYRGKKGHPVLFAAHLAPDILALPETAILRDFIHSRAATIVDVDDPGIGMDIDSMQDYLVIKQYFIENMG